MVRTDEDLVRGLTGSASEAALRALYHAHGGAIYGYALRRLGDRGLAEEVVQEVFTRVWRGAAGFDPRQGGFRPWLYGIAHNAVVDVERRRAVRPWLSAHEEDEGVSADEPIERAMLRWQIRAALDRLSADHRQVIRMCHFEGLTLREIAARTGLPLGTVKSRLSYALRNLRLTLEEMGVAP